MNSKTTKTLVFAALLAAMILPFGGMQTVDAVHNAEHVPGGVPTAPIPDGESEQDPVPGGEADRELPNPVPGGEADEELPEVIPDGSRMPEGDLPDGTHGPEVEIILGGPIGAPVPDGGANMPEGSVPAGPRMP